MTEEGPNPVRCEMLAVIEQALEEAGASNFKLPYLHGKIVDAADAYAASERKIVIAKLFDEENDMILSQDNIRSEFNLGEIMDEVEKEEQPKHGALRDLLKDLDNKYGPINTKAIRWARKQLGVDRPEDR